MGDHSLAVQTIFDQLKQTNPDGTEFWSARELMTQLGYSKWERFVDAMTRARTSCEVTTGASDTHFFPAPGKSTGGRPQEDWKLSRYACYLTAMNGDPRKTEVAAAQRYFAVKTRQAELAPASPLALSRLMLESLEQQEARVSALEAWRDNSPITSEKVGTIHRLGQQLGQLMGNYRRAWSLFNDHFGLASYRDLPTFRYEEAVRFLRIQIAAYTGQPLLSEVTL